MSNTVLDIIEKRKHLAEKIAALDKAIESFRAICEHEWMPAGNDSHHDYEVCRHCGERRKI
jgi:hypothetical protein